MCVYVSVCVLSMSAQLKWCHELRHNGIKQNATDLVGVASETLDVVLDPLEGQDLVKDAHVAAHSLVFGSQEA